MGVLTETPDCKIYTKKCRLSVNPAFNYVLDIQKLYKEDCLTDLEKIDAALEVLVRNSWNLRLLNPKERAEVMEEIAARSNVTRVLIFAILRQSYLIMMQFFFII